jgi:DNA-binding YbaB/EbfC family protein
MQAIFQSAISHSTFNIQSSTLKIHLPLTCKKRCFMFDMMKMMGKVKEVQGRLKEAQDNLANITASAESGGGMVKATVNGKKKLISLDIDAAILKPDDKVLVQDLVVAAVNKAIEEADVLAKEEMRKSTDGLLPTIPGMDLSSMMGI